jgi:tetratricopeptide (TPR) repeat protein
VEIYREFGEASALAGTLGNLGGFLRQTGEFDRAMAMHKEAERLWRRSNDLGGVARALMNQGLVVMNQGDLDVALQLMKTSEGMCRDLGLAEGVAIALSNQALALERAPGRESEALALAEEGYSWARDHSMTQHMRDFLPLVARLQMRAVMDRARHIDRQSGT